MANNDLWIKIKSAFSGEGFKKAEASMKNLGQTAGNAGRNIGNISGALGGISGEAGKAAGAIGKIGAAFAGGGIWGVVIGGATAALGAMYKKLQDTRDEVKKLEEQMVNSFLKQLDIGFNAVGAKISKVKDNFTEMFKSAKNTGASKSLDIQLGVKREQIANKQNLVGLEGSAKTKQQLANIAAEEKTRQKAASEQLAIIGDENNLLKKRNEEIEKSIISLQAAFDKQYNQMKAEADKIRAYRHSNEYKGMSEAEQTSINTRHKELKAGLKKMQDEEKKSLEARIASLRGEIKANADAIAANNLKSKTISNDSIVGYDTYNMQKAELEAQLKKELADEAKKRKEKKKKDKSEKLDKKARSYMSKLDERRFDESMRQQEDIANRLNNVKAEIARQKAAVAENTKMLDANNKILEHIKLNNKQVLSKDAQRAQRLQQRQEALAAKKQEKREQALAGRIEHAWHRVRRGMGSSADKALLAEWGVWYMNRKNNTTERLQEKNQDIQKKIAENEENIKQLMKRQQELQQMFIEAAGNN